MTELVDHLPASDTIPSPEKVLGYAVGTPNKLTHVADLNKYYRALAAASPRVRVLVALEKSEEGREQLLIVVSDQANLAKAIVTKRSLQSLVTHAASVLPMRKRSSPKANQFTGHRVRFTRPKPARRRC